MSFFPQTEPRTHVFTCRVSDWSVSEAPFASSIEGLRVVSPGKPGEHSGGEKTSRESPNRNIPKIFPPNSSASSPTDF